MSAMRTMVFILFPLYLLCACGGKQPAAAQRPPLRQDTDFDTLVLEKGAVLHIQRYRVYRNKKALFNIGKMNMQLTVNDMQTGVNAAYTVDSGTLVYNNACFTARCYISTQQVKTLHTDTAQHPVLRTPPYLLRSNKPYMVLEYTGNFFPPEQNPSGTCALTINDTTGLLNNADNRVTVKNKIIESINTHAWINGLQWQLYEPVNGESIQKDSLVLDLLLRFRPMPRAAAAQ